MDVSERCPVCNGPVYRDNNGTIRCLAFAPSGIEAGDDLRALSNRGAVDHGSLDEAPDLAREYARLLDFVEGLFGTPATRPD